MKAETFDIYLKPYIHDDLASNYIEMFDFSIFEYCIVWKVEGPCWK